MRVSEWVSEQKRLAETATEGPWGINADKADAEHDMPVYTVPGGHCIGFSPDDGVRAGFERADALFIAASRSSVPVLVGMVEAVLAIHMPVDVERNALTYQVCRECSWQLPNGRYLGKFKYPCATVAAIENALPKETS